MFILYQDGIIISLDFTKIAKKWQGRSWIISVLFSDYNYTFFYILFVHFITLLVYLKYYRRRTSEIEPLRNRHNEINQVIQDIIRLNNIQMAIGNNLQNINRVNNNVERVERPEGENQQNQNINRSNQNLNGHENENDIQVIDEPINQGQNINIDQIENSNPQHSNNQLNGYHNINTVVNNIENPNVQIQQSEQNAQNEHNQIVFDNVSDNS
jgi:hypothetical protein